jgi:hypothetical protein
MQTRLRTEVKRYIILEYTNTEVSNVGLPYEASAELDAVCVHTFSVLLYFHC